MAKFKTRLEYNSMGERVIVKTAVESIDAFAARSRQDFRRKQQHEQNRSGALSGEGFPKSVHYEEQGESGVVTSTAAGGQESTLGMHGNPSDDGNIDGNGGSGGGSGSSSAVGELLDHTPQPLPSQNVSQSLGFGFPDFSSVTSKVCLQLFVHTFDLPCCCRGVAPRHFMAIVSRIVRRHPHIICAPTLAEGISSSCP